MPGPHPRHDTLFHNPARPPRELSPATFVAGMPAEDRTMTQSTVTTLSQTGMNAFLFSEVGAEANGMALSVISVFARKGADPWAEATRLARLPKAAAIESLAGTIAGMPDSHWNKADAATIAARLVELLPGRVATIAQPAATVASAWRPTNRTLILALGVALGIAFTVMMLTRDRSGMSVETPTGQSSASDSGIVR